MLHQLRLDDKLLHQGELKTVTALFNDLSGQTFAREGNANWLNKMSARESYATYLRIKAEEYGLGEWSGTLFLCEKSGEVIRAHLFETHKNILPQPNQRDKKTG